MPGKKITNDDMPDGMAAQPGEGDIEEAFQDVITDVEPENVMPPQLSDGDILASIDREHRRMMDDIDVDDARREAVMGQERADEAVAMAETRAEEGTAEDFEATFTTGFDSDFGVK